VFHLQIAGLGTDLEKKVRLDAAQTEEQWHGVGATVGLKIWRIENFKVVPWPEKEYGMFYSGDSYIVVNVSDTAFLANCIMGAI
jgi:gelsolin